MRRPGRNKREASGLPAGGVLADEGGEGFGGGAGAEGLAGERGLGFRGEAAEGRVGVEVGGEGVAFGGGGDGVGGLRPR